MTSLGKYELHEQLGKGGFGTVYRATDTTLDRVVALKVLHPQLMVDDVFINRFKKEARALAALENHHIVTIHEISETDGRISIAMRYLADGNLKQVIKKHGPLPFHEASEIILQVLKGLKAAHEHGFIHRDLKPENILSDGQGEYVITDLGLVRDSQGSASSSTGGITGTPNYIAPEIWRGQPATPSTDIYSVGCILYELLTGRVLFEGDTPAYVMMKHLLEGPQLSGSFAPEVEALLQTALAQDPADRFSSAEALSTALRELNTPHAPVTPPMQPTPTWSTEAEIVESAIESSEEEQETQAESDSEPQPLSPPADQQVPMGVVTEPQLETRPRADWKKITLFIAGGIAVITLVVIGMTNGWFMPRASSPTLTEVSTFINVEHNTATLEPSAVKRATYEPYRTTITPSEGEFSHDPVMSQMFYAPHPMEAIKRIGKGSIVALNYIELSNQLIIVSKTGVYKYSPDDFSLIEYYPLPENIDSLVVSESGGILAFINPESEIEVMNLQDGSSKKLTKADGYLSTMNFSNDGRYLVFRDKKNSESEVFVWDVNSKELIDTMIIGSYGKRVAVSNDALFVATSDENNNLFLWNRKTGEIMTFTGHTGGIIDIAISNNSTIIASSDMNDQVILWEIESGKLLSKVSYRANSIEFTGDDRKLICKSWEHVLVWELNSESINPNQLYLLDISTESIDYYNDQTLFYSSNGIITYDYVLDEVENVFPEFGAQIVNRELLDSNIFRYGEREIATIDLFAGEIINVSNLGLNKSSELQSPKLSNYNNMIAFTSYYWVYPVCEVELFILDASSLKIVERYELDCGGGYPEFSSDDQYIAVNYDYDRIAIIQNGIISQYFDGDYHGEFVFSNNTAIFAALRGSSVDLLNAANGDFLGSLNCGQGSIVRSVGFSSDDKILACGSENNKINIWDLEENKIISAFEVEGYATAISFSPNEGYLGVGINNEQASELMVINYFDGSISFVKSIGDVIVKSLKFADSGHTLISKTNDDIITHWDLRENNQIDLLNGVYVSKSEIPTQTILISPTPYQVTLTINNSNCEARDFWMDDNVLISLKPGETGTVTIQGGVHHRFQSCWPENDTKYCDFSSRKTYTTDSNIILPRSYQCDA